MAFEYRLESLLRLQRSIEHQEENRLLACAARVTGLKADLQAWEKLRLSRREQANSHLEQGTTAVFLQFAAEWDRAARALQKEIGRQLRAAEADRQKQMHGYRAARQKREVLESLKQRLQDTYTVEQLRRIQQSLDETYLIRNFSTDPR